MTSISSSSAALEVELQEKEIMQEKCQVHAGEEDLDGQHQHVEESIRMRTEINGESMSMVWPTLGSRTA